MGNLKISIGADPEVFCRNPNTRELVSAYGMIQGTKYQPLPVRNGAVQVDGNALEFNITPAYTQDEFLRNIKDVYQQLKDMVPGYNVVPEPIAAFSPEYFNSLPEAAKELGCDPDFNAYSGKVNPRPEIFEPVRSAGGHIHIGWTQDVDIGDPGHFADCQEIAKQMDYYLGMWS